MLGWREPTGLGNINPPLYPGWRDFSLNLDLVGCVRCSNLGEAVSSSNSGTGCQVATLGFIR